MTPVRTGPFPDDELPLAGDQRRIADRDALHVGDRVEGPRRALERDAEVPRRGLACWAKQVPAANRQCAAKAKITILASVMAMILLRGQRLTILIPWGS